ncbi:RHOMBOID-like protein 12, mitochondrial isoform X2 [Hevea brasiliensis]|uniref:RHOMBOID-like protein 12, mitochondrial isoform X2 n=1 Tax=Hevea brasiliensis TaxID=3981 RepID=UPI0025D8E6B6|nr:RHOMBOID-like protein 12, mitochondrial isoform X2 [Hevea brasiliensis]
MQRLISLKLASSKFSKKLAISTNSSPSLSHPYYNAFTFLAKPTHHSYQQQNYIFGFSQLSRTHSSHSCQYHHTLSPKVHGFLSNPLLSKKFMSNLSNTHFKFSSKGLADYKFGIFSARFARGYSGFNQGFGSYGRSRGSWFYQISANDMVLGLILANVGVFMLWRIADKKFMVNNFMISLDNFKSGRVHTLITSAFSHIDTEHILSNMIGLYFFGMNGQGMWVTDPSRTPGLGASGAVNAIMLLDIFLNPRSTLYLDFIIPVPAILLGIFLMGKDVLRILEGNSNISGSAHLGGAAVAAIAYARIRKGRF